MDTDVSTNHRKIQKYTTGIPRTSALDPPKTATPPTTATNGTTSPITKLQGLK